VSGVFEDEVEYASSSPLKSKRYLLKIARLELSDHPQYGPGVRWVFNCADADTTDGKPAVIRDQDGSAYEYFQTTGTKIQAPKPGAAKIPKAYKFAVAFLGRAIAVGESGSDIARELLGKKAEAFLGPSDNGNLAIMAIDPLGTNYPQFRTNGKAPAPVSAPEPEPQPELVGAAAGNDEF
jgi:hypothetical protein